MSSKSMKNNQTSIQNNKTNLIFKMKGLDALIFVVTTVVFSILTCCKCRLLTRYLFWYQLPQNKRFVSHLSIQQLIVTVRTVLLAMRLRKSYNEISFL